MGFQGFGVSLELGLDRSCLEYPFLVQLGRNELHGRSFRNLVCRPAACRYPLRKVMLVPLVAWFTPNLTVHRPPQSELGRSRLGSTVSEQQKTRAKKSEGGSPTVRRDLRNARGGSKGGKANIVQANAVAGRGGVV